MNAAAIYSHAKDSVVAIEVTTREGKAFGTGFFYGDGQTVATCNHVVDGATKIVVRGTHGGTWSPNSMSFDQAGDTVLLHLTSSAKRQAFAAAKKTAIGDPIFVIGNPLGILTGSMSTGIVAAQRKLDALPLVQMTAPISEGSSGSPVLDRYGNVVGMVSFTFQDGQNLNMAIGNEVLKWVAAGNRRVPIQALYAANNSSGAALHFTKSEPNEKAAPAETKVARKAFASRLAQYDGDVIDAFVRWQVTSQAWTQHTAGIKDEDAQRALNEFGATVAGKGHEAEFAELARSAGEEEYYAKLQREAQAVCHVADDKFRQEQLLASLGKGDSVDSAKKANEAQYTRLVQAICDLGAATEDPSWMDVEDLYNHFPTTAKGQCVMLHQDAFVDPDLPRSTTLRAALPASPFKAGDQIIGAKVAGRGIWEKVGNWDDLWNFTALHRGDLCTRGWQVRVVRDGKEIAIGMCRAHA